jgi:hypothetical protein
VAVVVGSGVGVLTSAAQTWLGNTAVAGLANGVSPWVMAPFFLGSRGRDRRSAALLGLLACLAEVAGYYVAAALRGFAISPLFAGVWVAAAIVAGPVFGLGGHSWRTAAGRESGLGAALLVAVWACEATVTYAVVLGYFADAAVFGAIAVGLFAVLGLRGNQHLAVLAWLLPALLLGASGMLVLHTLL